MSPMIHEIVCVGLATLDTIVRMPAWPEADGRMLVEPALTAGGGPAATAAVTIARFGGRVAFVGAVGDDEAGALVRDGLAGAGVEVEDLVTRPGPTSQSVILLDTSAGTRSILHAPGVELPALAAEARERAANPAWIHVDHAGYPLVVGLDRSRISVDAGNPIDGLELEGLGLYAPTARQLASRYPGTDPAGAARRAVADGARAVAVTLGADGAIVADADGAWRIAGFAVEVRSTLGAGDVFHGALLASLAAGHALPEAARRANVAAALSCRGMDGRSAVPTIGELEAALDRAPEVEPILLDHPA